MKYIVSWILLLCMLCGCASLEEDVPDTKIPDISSMTDEELIMAIGERLWSVVFSAAGPEAGFARLTDAQKVVFALNYLDMEVANGGLCQFFANDRGLLSPHISESLKTVGALEHQALFDGFVAAHGIDVQDLTEFAFTSIESFVELYDLYPFDEFDDAYYELDALSSYLAEFVRAHPEDF